MEAYIRNTGIISPQNTLSKSKLTEHFVEYEGVSMNCIEPDYKEYLNPVSARRMGRIIKMGVAAAKMSMAGSGTEMPDAIITGTGLGCIEDTEKFLISIIENDEKLLPPTSFIQSTHNTVSAQIALELKCNNYNFTYVHRTFSFETALLDALMMFEEKEAASILLGAADEITSNSISILSRLGILKRKPIKNSQLYSSNSPGSMAGEGASFFLLGQTHQKGDLAKIRGVKTLFDPEGSLLINSEILQFLDENGLSGKDIDLVVYGFNGDTKFDYAYEKVIANIFPDTAAAYYKHLCGEYFTSSAFAMWLAANCINNNHLPAHCIRNNKFPSAVNNILLYNQFRNTDHSFILLGKC